MSEKDRRWNGQGTPEPSKRGLAGSVQKGSSQSGGSSGGTPRPGGNPRPSDASGQGKK